MQSHRALLVTGVCVAASACNTIQAQSRVDPQTVAIYPALEAGTTTTCVKKIAGDRRLGAIDLDCLYFPGQTDKLAYQKAADSKGARNRLAAILIKQSDDVCTLELGRLTANQATVNAGLGIATTAFGTAGSIVTGQLAGNILAGLASGTNATRDHLNAEVYRNALSTAVTRAITDERSKQRGTLIQNFVKDKDVYTVDQMIMDVNRYHQVCSFFTGLQLVVKAVDRASFYAKDPRRTAALAVDNVRAQIASINRQLARKDITAEEKQELLTQRADLRTHETALVKAWTALPVAPVPNDTDAPDEPAPEPVPEPEPEPTDATNTTGG